MIARITEAARASFAHNGWAGRTLRGVARDVGVDPARVHYYFSSKEELLDSSTNPPERWTESILAAGAQPLRSRGEAIIRNVIWTWSEPDPSETLGSILLTAAHEPRTREKLKAFMTTGIVSAVAERLQGEERLVRASLVSSQVLGVTMMRWIWKVEPLASLPDEERSWSRSLRRRFSATCRASSLEPNLRRRVGFRLGGRAALAVVASRCRARHGQPALQERLVASRAVHNVGSAACVPVHPHISVVGVLMCNRTGRASDFSTFCTPGRGLSVTARSKNRSPPLDFIS